MIETNETFLEFCVNCIFSENDSSDNVYFLKCNGTDKKSCKEECPRINK